MKNRIIILVLLTVMLVVGCSKTKSNSNKSNSNLVHLNNSNFTAEIKDGIAIVDFWAEWCGPCRRIAPIFAELASEMTDVTFGKVDVDTNKALAKKYKVRSIPYLVIFKDGKPIDSILGLRDKEFIRNKLEEFTKN
ncbi:MAG: thioredoxin [Candidatus Cloacimonadota bacterium]|nr:thioredoxin [Candidatus Cloacimonadota bacterium]